MSDRILLLQALRAAAALSVTVHHTLHEPYGGGGTSWLSNLPWQAGVDVFFVISGFVMVHASGRLFGTPAASRVFLGRRLARIVPLYWATTTAFLLVVAIVPSGVRSESPGLVEILASYGFIPWPRADGAIQPAYSLGWTLNYEMMFYVIFALFLPLSRGRAVTSVAAVLGCVVVVGFVFPPRQPALEFWCDPVVLEFVLGMGLALLAARGVVLPGVVRLGLALLGLVLLGVMPAVALVPPFMIGALLLVAGAVLGPEPRLHSFVSIWMVRLGDASYALYLLHPFVLRVLTVTWGALGLTSLAAASLVSAAALVLASLVALVGHAWFEAPVTRGLTLRIAGTRVMRT